METFSITWSGGNVGDADDVPLVLVAGLKLGITLDQVMMNITDVWEPCVMEKLTFDSNYCFKKKKGAAENSPVVLSVKRSDLFFIAHLLKVF